MGKLIKYEFRKQLMSKLIVGIVVAVLELVFLAGLIFDKGDWAGTGAGLLLIASMVSLLYFSFESIVTYSNDLRTKQSYMLFLTPRNMFQIVGAKLLTTILQIVVCGCAFAAIGIGDVLLVCAKNGEVKDFLDGIKGFFHALTGVEIRLVEVVYVILMLLVAWLVFIALAMFAITLSSTLLSTWKFKGVLSVGIYFALDWCVSKVATLVTPTGFLESEYLVVNTEAWAFIGVYAAALVLSYVGTALLLEKKVSV